jgi:hypothetical protein
VRALIQLRDLSLFQRDPAGDLFLPRLPRQRDRSARQRAGTAHTGGDQVRRDLYHGLSQTARMVPSAGPQAPPARHGPL